MASEAAMDMMKAPEHGTSRKVRGSGIILPGERKAQGAGALANGEHQMLTSCSLSP